MLEVSFQAMHTPRFKNRPAPCGTEFIAHLTHGGVKLTGRKELADHLVDVLTDGAPHRGLTLFFGFLLGKGHRTSLGCGTYLLSWTDICRRL